jgi:hypothetical protein
MRYAHTFLFACPDCQLPTSITRISSEKNLETLDGQSLEITCGYCLAESKVHAISAEYHYVSSWPRLTSGQRA